MEKELELKMCFFVLNQLNDLEKGIQCGKSALRYVRKYATENPIVWEFVDMHEKWEILECPSTNDEYDYDNIVIGDLNKIGESLYANGVDFSIFRDTNLNNSLTSICFIVDERVFNKEDYPDFENYLMDKISYVTTKEFIDSQPLKELKESFHVEYKEWIRLIGGIKNEFLRELIKNRKKL